MDAIGKELEAKKDPDHKTWAQKAHSQDMEERRISRNHKQGSDGSMTCRKELKKC